MLLDPRLDKPLRGASCKCILLPGVLGISGKAVCVCVWRGAGRGGAINSPLPRQAIERWKLQMQTVLHGALGLSGVR